MTDNLRKVGWCWEGLAFDPGVLPTVYGVGEGAAYFGVDGANFMFHPNTETGFAKLAPVPKVTAEISKWRWHEIQTEDGRTSFVQRVDAATDHVVREAETVSRLSRQFPNIQGAFIDDTQNIIRHPSYTPDTPRRIREALARYNPGLRLWIVAYTHEENPEVWAPWIEAADVINLWVWECRNLPLLEQYIEQARRRFPNQDLVMGIYMRDYPTRSPVPLDLMERQLETVATQVRDGALAGFNILGACLIDQHPEQARLIRDFIAAHGTGEDAGVRWNAKGARE